MSWRVVAGKYSNGFTLIELMVAIAIVAILAVVGLVVYSNLQRQARDARRTQDLSAVANALEANKNPGEIVYQPLTAAEFAGGAVPTDPRPTVSVYCIWGNSSVPPTVPLTQTTIAADWTTHTACGAVGGASYNAAIGAGIPPAATALTSWTVCAALEGTTGITCKQNKL